MLGATPGNRPIQNSPNVASAMYQAADRVAIDAAPHGAGDDAEHNHRRNTGRRWPKMTCQSVVRQWLCQPRRRLGSASQRVLTCTLMLVAHTHMRVAMEHEGPGARRRLENLSPSQAREPTHL